MKIQEMINEMEAIGYSTQDAMARVDHSDKRWIDAPINDIFEKILDYLRGMT